MPNQRNIKNLETVSAKFARAKSVYFTDFKGMTVQQMTDLRKELYKAQIDFQVVKKTLTKIAARQQGWELTDDIMPGQIGLAICYDDPTAGGKLLLNYIKKNRLEKLAITGCIFEGSIFTQEQVKTIVDLPSKQELLATILGTLQAPMSNLLSVLKASLSQLLGTLESLKEKKNQ
jgi:large subunit ribosomal protein L10